MGITLNTSDCGGRSHSLAHRMTTNTLIKKPVVSFLFLVAMFSYTNAQLKVDAGNDVIFCAGDDFTKVRLGSCPVVSGGVEPYKFTWSGIHQPFPSMRYWIHASDMLDDTTKSNPSFRRMPTEDWFTFYLKVEDAENNIGYDSVKVRSSYFHIYTIGPRYVVINRGDSVSLPGNMHFDSNFWPFKYYITPSYGLSDSTNSIGWAKPDTSMNYFMYVENPVGCVSRKVLYFVVDVVDTTIVSYKPDKKQEIQCYFEHGSLVVNLPDGNNSLYSLTVHNLLGQVIHSGQYNEPYLRLTGLGLKSNQLYIISIACNNKKYVYKLFRY